MFLNRPSFMLKLTVAFVFLFLYIPLVVVILYSFNDSRVSIGWVGFTLKWYRILFHDVPMLDAIKNSLIIATISSLFSVVLGTFAGVALSRYKLPFLNILVFTPIASPELLVGVALLLFYLMVNFTLGLVAVAFAHIAFCLSFVAITVKTRMENIDQNILDAARDLGADSFYTFTKVLLPMLMPGIIAGGLMAFTLSIDDFIITFFTAGPDSNTLPLAIYSMLKIGVTPEVNAISTFIIIVTIVLTMISARLTRNKG